MNVLLIQCVEFLIILVMFLKSMAGDANDKSFLKKALRGVRAIICPNVCMSRTSLPAIYNILFHTHHDFLQVGFLSTVESLKGVQHVILLSQVLL